MYTENWWWNKINQSIKNPSSPKEKSNKFSTEELLQLNRGLPECTELMVSSGARFTNIVDRHMYRQISECGENFLMPLV